MLGHAFPMLKFNLLFLLLLRIDDLLLRITFETVLLYRGLLCSFVISVGVTADDVFVFDDLSA